MENKGQWDARAKFLARSSAVDMWVTSTGIVYDWHEDKAQGAKTERKVSKTAMAVGVEFVGATGTGSAEGIRPLPGIDNFYLGSRKTPHVRSFGAARLNDLYPGIDLIAYFDENEHRPRYDLVVHPGADPNRIRMRYAGAEKLKVSPEGEVNYSVALGDRTIQVGEQRQMAYQDGDRGVPFRFLPKQVLEKDGTVGFNVDGYRSDRTLVIDPLVWSSYLGAGVTEFINAVRADTSSNVFVAGQTSSPAFPTTTGVPMLSDSADALVAKFDASGNRIYSTVFGTDQHIANAEDEFTSARAIGIDASGNTYIAGLTQSPLLPVTNGSIYPGNDPSTGYWAKFDLTGALLFCDYLSGPGTDQGDGNTPMYVSPSGNSVIGVDSLLFRVSSGGVAAAPFTGFAGTGEVFGIDVDSSGNMFVAGATLDLTIAGFSGYSSTNGNVGFSQLRNANTVISKFLPGGTSPVQETLLPTIGEDIPNGLLVDPSGLPTVFGIVFPDSQTDLAGNPVDANLPTTPGAYQSGPIGPDGTGFVSKFSNDLTTLVASTEFTNSAPGGNINIFGNAIDSNGCPVICGTEFGGGVPLTWDYFSGHQSQSFVARLSSDLTTLLYGTYYGESAGTLTAVDVDSAGLLYLVGYTNDGDYPTTPGAFQTTFPGAFAGIMGVLDPKITSSLNSIHSDRGATPAIAGGVGKSTTIAVQFAEPIGTAITLSSDHVSLVQINGAASGVYTTVGSEHLANFTVSAVQDVAIDTPVVLTASDGTHSISLTLTIKPFLRLLVLQPTTLASGGTLKGFVYPYEVPLTDQTVNIAANPSADLPATTATITGLVNGGTGAPGTFTAVAGQVSVNSIVNVTASLQGGVSSASAAFTLLGDQVKSIGFSPATVNGGQSSTVTVTLKNAPTTDQVLTLTSTKPGFAPDVSVTVHANSVSGTASVTALQAGSTSSTVGVRYSELSNSPSVSGLLTVIPVQVASMSLDRISIAEGDTPNLTIKLNYTVANAQPVTVFCSTPAYVNGLSATVPGGSDNVTVPLPTNFTGLTAGRLVRIDGQVGSGKVAFTSLTINPEVVSVSLSPLSVAGGSSCSGLVQLFEAYGGIGNVTVSSNSPFAFFGIPGVLSESIPAHGLVSVPFTVSTKSVTAARTVVITVTALNRAPVKFNLLVHP